MSKPVDLRAVEAVELLTLQDNAVDLIAADSSDVVDRASGVRGGRFRHSLSAEHGLSMLLTVHHATDHDELRQRQLLFDFGFSAEGAAKNADALGVDLSNVAELVLSHGHIDHFGGLGALLAKVGRSAPLVTHPAAFRRRHMRSGDRRIEMPPLLSDELAASGVTLHASAQPRLLAGGHLLYLGEIPRETAFETPHPAAFYDDGGSERPDPLEDDSGVVALVRGRGLVILSGCAHSGIVNTVRYARRLTGEKRILAIIGGFHLNGPLFEQRIEATIDALAELRPRHVVPTHCTGRRAVNRFEQRLPEQFVHNLVGLRLRFTA